MLARRSPCDRVEVQNESRWSILNLERTPDTERSPPLLRCATVDACFSGAAQRSLW
jgi:hypothetical protein